MNYLSCYSEEILTLVTTPKLLLLWVRLLLPSAGNETAMRRFGDVFLLF